MVNGHQSGGGDGRSGGGGGRQSGGGGDCVWSGGGGGHEVEKEKKCKNVENVSKNDVRMVENLAIDVEDDDDDHVQIAGEKPGASYVYVSSDSDTDSGGLIFCRDVVKVKIDEKDGYVGQFYVGNEETVREGKASVMLINEYDATEMKGYVPLARLYENHDDYECNVRETSLKRKIAGSKNKGTEKRSEKKVSDSSEDNVGFGSKNKGTEKRSEKKVSDSSEYYSGGGSGSVLMLNNSEKPSKKMFEKFYKRRPGVGNIDHENAINLLMASILLEVDKSGAPCLETKLPQKFRFEDEDPAPPPEKEPWEKESDDLFTEMDMCLTAIYSADANVSSSSSKTEETDELLRAKSTLERCRLGHHVEVLEEPTGIICKFCQLVITEMKYIFPNLISRAPRKRDSFYSRRDDSSEYSHKDIPLGDSVSENYVSSIQNEGSVLDLIPSRMRKSMYQHQLDGFAFLWKNVVGETNIEKLKELEFKEGGGCIISHAPGTGKTFLSIVFITTLMRAFDYPECRPMIVAPKSMLLTWQKEFEKWDSGFPFHNLNSDELSGKEIEVLGINKMVWRQNGLDNMVTRKLKLCSWMRQRSILGVSYNLFKQIINGPEKQFLLEKPGLLVLDEGHTPRNKKSCLWKALKEVKTRKRIILSGTPFQNSFEELQTILHLVNPDLSSNSDFNWKNLKPNAIDKENDNGIAKLKAMIDPLVHVYTGDILKQRLPGLKDVLIILRPTDEQNRAFEAISDNLNHFEKEHLVSLISVHPSLASGKREFLNPESGLEFLDDPSPDAGVKTKFVMELVRLCNALKEKVVIFCESLSPLKFLKEKFKETLSWIEGREILYIDGKQGAKMRQSSINCLNDPRSEAKVLLASTKVCSEGIHLVGASRVVLLDVSWNPSVEEQAKSRAFRLGQTKVVYVYHLIVMGTLEMAKYEMQAQKHRLAQFVFSSRDLESKKENNSTAVAQDKVLEQMMDMDGYKGIFEKIVQNSL